MTTLQANGSTRIAHPPPKQQCADLLPQRSRSTRRALSLIEGMNVGISYSESKVAHVSNA
jgi:hypothetical protein